MKLNFFFIFFLFSFSQTFSSQAIEWSPDRKLNFNDFKGNMPLKTNVDDTNFEIAGEVIAEIKYKIVSTSIWTGNIKVKIYAVLDTEKCWINKEHISNYVLNHEQKHFDISHIFASKLQNIVNSRIKSVKDFNDNFQKLYDEIYNEESLFQLKYDLETKHGLNVEVQNKYNDIISKMIDT